MNTENKTPLWKELNDKKTNGIWELNNPKDDTGTPISKINEEFGHQEYFTISIHHSFDAVGFLYPKTPKEKEQMIADAQAICLAVNNLHHLAEALESIVKWHESHKIVTHSANHLFINAKEALNRIS